jgi:hypothetical protein
MKNSALILSIIALLLSIWSFTGSNLFDSSPHDGQYKTESWMGDITLTIDGNQAIINTSITGSIKVDCKQYDDRVEMISPNRVQIFYSDKQGNLLVGVGDLMYKKIQ